MPKISVKYGARIPFFKAAPIIADVYWFNPPPLLRRELWRYKYGLYDCSYGAGDCDSHGDYDDGVNGDICNHGPTTADDDNGE